ncbi:MULTISPECIES: hypothetical protein [Mycobacteriaceae]|uniref:Uncharacterized protein n=1 Tax=Mycolicibacterium parafortuitum TaxID=39692 RepID=A0ACC6MMU4_MYCPF|nr:MULTISPECIES: hypothetical protein [Mycobacteriaceae]MDZ5088294.1 hypothetical protein [Mycolicibacterium parafortuitum]GFM21124.1 uncharacterized protein PO1_contig-108-10 [Mycobacterium sp. PO1]GFM23587.1 uncharacterized protein PO2_contig-027-10 [Mycobacterium sp. PO2]
MRKHAHTLVAGVSALAAFGMLTACSGNSSAPSSTEAQPGSQTSAVSEVPESARYMADVAAADGKTMTIGLSIDGDSVAAYACNGVDDEAWFFGTQTAGDTEITSKFRDTLAASFDGAVATGELTMNGVAYDFTADQVSGLAGMYTAEVDGVRDSWVVRPDGSATGVRFSGFAEDRRNFDPFNLDEFSDFDVRNDIRPSRTLRPADPIEFEDGAPKATINGVSVTPELVTGTFRLG